MGVRFWRRCCACAGMCVSVCVSGWFLCTRKECVCAGVLLCACLCVSACVWACVCGRVCGGSLFCVNERGHAWLC